MTDKSFLIYKVNSEHAQACCQKHLVVFEQLMVYADGLCAAAHAVVQLRLQGETRDGSLVCMLLHCCKGFLKFLKAEQAVCLQGRAIFSATSQVHMHQASIAAVRIAIISLLTNMSPIFYTHLLKGQLLVAGCMLVYVLYCLLKPGKLD